MPCGYMCITSIECPDATPFLRVYLLLCSLKYDTHVQDSLLIKRYGYTKNYRIPSLSHSTRDHTRTYSI
jgi:hypothetical protein